MESVDIVPSWAEDNRRKKIGYKAGHTTNFSYMSFEIDAAIPIFDFGSLFDKSSRVYKESPLPKYEADYYDQAKDLARIDNFHLPYPECFFIFRGVGHARFAQTYEIVDLLHCKELDNKIIVTSFQWMLDGYLKKELWHVLPMTFEFSSDTLLQKKGFMNPITQVSFTQQLLEAFKRDGENHVSMIAVSTMMIADEKPLFYAFSSTKPSQFAASVNAGRKRARLQPITTPIVLDLNAIRYVEKPTKVPGTPKCPHDVRGYHRKHKGGILQPTNQWKWVNAYKKKGGRVTSPSYEVTT
jgi:hypothetical protein